MATSRTWSCTLPRCPSWGVGDGGRFIASQGRHLAPCCPATRCRGKPAESGRPFQHVCPQNGPADRPRPATPARRVQVADGYRPPMLATVPAGARAAIEACWKGDADLRPTAAEVVERLVKLQESGELPLSPSNDQRAQNSRQQPQAALPLQQSCRLVLRMLAASSQAGQGVTSLAERLPAAVQAKSLRRPTRQVAGAAAP